LVQFTRKLNSFILFFISFIILHNSITIIYETVLLMFLFKKTLINLLKSAKTLEIGSS